ncbi:MAG: LPP20 family lipoprotein [Pseudomonadota bacterium]
MAYHKFSRVIRYATVLSAVGLGVAPPAYAESGSASTASALECTPEGMAAFFQMDGQKLAEARVNASGYGAPPKSFYPEPQRRLMSMRAAQVDAYRNLAERVNGMHIWGGTTIGDMVVEKDRYRVFLDSYLKGAKVMASHPVEDGTYETVVELNLDQSFLRAALGMRPCPEHLTASVPASGSSAAQERFQPMPSVSVAPTAPVMPIATTTSGNNLERQPTGKANPAEPTAPASAAEPPAKTSTAPAANEKKSGKNSLYFSEDE